MPDGKMTLAAAAAQLRPAEEQVKLKGKICERCGAKLQPHRMPEGYWWTGDEPWIDYRYGLVLNLDPDGKVQAEWCCDGCAPHVRMKPLVETYDLPRPVVKPAQPVNYRSVAGVIVGSPEALALKGAKITPRRYKPATKRRR